MSGFSADWLALREPHDLRARSPAVVDAVAASLEPLSSVRIVDLACGTGATLRALSPHLPARQNWKLIDNDLSLLVDPGDALALAMALRRVIGDAGLRRRLAGAAAAAAPQLPTWRHSAEIFARALETLA